MSCAKWEVDGNNVHETVDCVSGNTKDSTFGQTTDRIGRGRYNFSISVQDRPPPLPSALLLLLLLLLSQMLFYMGAASFPQLFTIRAIPSETKTRERQRFGVGPQTFRRRGSLSWALRGLWDFGFGFGPI